MRQNKVSQPGGRSQLASGSIQHPDMRRYTAPVEIDACTIDALRAKSPLESVDVTLYSTATPAGCAK
jgi:hypothetical protein